METKEFEARLAREREAIDRIDRELLPLFIERMRCSERVARIKREAGAPVLSVQREREILDRVSREAGDFGGSAAALYQEIMAISRARQHQLLDRDSPLRDLERAARRELPQPLGRVVCQGVEGAYSHQAARCLFGGAPVSFVPQFSQVFQEVDQGALGVLPVENSAAGSVTAVYDLILRYRFFIVGAVDVRVEHCLAAPEAGPVKRVLSHPQALSQCSDYISAQGLEAAEFSNTAAAAEYVAQERPQGTAAICSREAAERWGLTILAQGVQNVKNNTTRFVAVSKEAVLPEEANKISLCFSLPHTTGSLYHILQRFAVGGLNLTKIESRPIPGRSFEYDFYLDFTGSIHCPGTLELICALQAELPRFSFLGNYSEAGQE
ncbi:bifunctional chorismate mutase/prephenate dehydratase [Acutalibacter sp.]|uniref:bifunctional chorismate mutase/prephenate dehydratase n=1 Tax=Acutalibacter sp. TaxID=1918636 RepID=UPI0021718679|nr:bifunctional chorismate mutase/prephenate dehydratase [Acutalibacter sp.]